MGENEQGGMLRTVIVLGLIALIGIVIFGAVNALNKQAAQTMQRRDLVAVPYAPDRDKITYHDDGTASLYGFKSTNNLDKDLTIPEYVTHNGKKYLVTEIGVGAYRNIGLTSLTLPDSIKTIGAYAFQDNYLTSVSLPSHLETLGDGAFYKNELTQVNVPGSVKTIGKLAFQYNKLTQVTINDCTENIGDGVFNNNKLTNITLPDSVTTVGPWAFSENNLRDNGISIGKNTSYVGTNDNAASFGSVKTLNIRN